jgi:hypothetical protein
MQCVAAQHQHYINTNIVTQLVGNNVLRTVIAARTSQ